MKKLDAESKKKAIIWASVVAIVYGIIFVLITLGQKNYYLLFALFGCPVLFWLVFCFVYTYNEGIINFLNQEKARDLYDNPIDNYTMSEFDKDRSSCILPVILFLPTFLFYLLFAWVYFLKEG